MLIELIDNITSIDNQKLYLPNSVQIDNNNLVIADGGNNRICVKNAKQEYCIGTFGIGKYKFKEPVYSMISESQIFVCDWHNHRIMQYDNKKFKNQIGLFGNKTNNYFKAIKLFMKSLAFNGSFIEKHFDNEIELPKKTSKKIKIFNFLHALWFYGINLRIFVENMQKEIYINKPNGCIVINNQLIFTQKNNRCISVFDLDKKAIVKEIDNGVQNINFGRLGQLSYFDKKVYVCDETNNFLWIFSQDLDFLDKKIVTKYNIFSISLNNSFIATCGETGFSIFNHKFELLFEKIGDGEYHGVALDENILYVCNRLKNQIEKYKIIEDEK